MFDEMEELDKLSRAELETQIELLRHKLSRYEQRIATLLKPKSEMVWIGGRRPPKEEPMKPSKPELKPVTFGNWDGETQKEVRRELADAFQAEIPDDITVIFAAYTYESYSGDALVLFEQNGKLYEVHGGHCSCDGLEGQWPTELEETDIAALSHRFFIGGDNDREWSKEYQAAVREYVHVR